MATRQDNTQQTTGANASWWKRARASMNAAMAGGPDNAWELALYGVQQESNKRRRQALARARLLAEGGVSAAEVSTHAFFQLMDSISGFHKPNTPGNTLADEACWQRWQAFELALASGMGADRQHQNSYWDFALHRAAVRGNIDLVELLLSSGCDPNSRDGNGYTPLAATLAGWGEKTGSEENREKIARLLIKKGANLSLGKRETNYNGEEKETYEISLLDSAAKFPGLMVDLIKAGAAITWKEPGYRTQDAQRIAGDQSTSELCHLLFDFEQDLWSSKNSAMLEILEQRYGTPLCQLRSTRGFTPAMELIDHLHGMIDKWQPGSKPLARDERKVVIEELLQRMIARNVIRLEDKTSEGSTIWHALTRSINEDSGLIGQVLMESFPDTMALMDVPNDAGVRPRDCVNHLLNGSPEYVQTQSGPVKATGRVHYDPSWDDDLKDLRAIFDRSSLNLVAQLRSSGPEDVPAPRPAPRL